MVANLAAPVLSTPRLPQDRSKQRPGDEPIDATPTSDDVRRVSIGRPAIKTDYSKGDLANALTASAHPFEYLGKSLNEVHAVVTGEDMPRPLVDKMARVGRLLDELTGLIPQVQRLRLPGYVAELAANIAKDKSVNAGQLADIVRMSDPRSLGAEVPMAPARSPADGLAPEHPPIPLAGGDSAPAEVSPVQQESPGFAHAAPEAPPYGEPGSDAQEAHNADESPVASEVSFDVPDALRSTIAGEHEHLRGYEQALSADALPQTSNGQPFFVNGHRYLAGRWGYYRVSPSHRSDLWLIDGPRGLRAQVPVSYDAHTGEWRAQQALRLNGGGILSRESTPDSVGASRHQVEDALHPVRERAVRDAILNAYADLGHLHLLRTNRPDLRPFRDNSIIEHRKALMPRMMELDQHGTLFEIQKAAAEATTSYYIGYPETANYHLGAEAFCQENSEILFHYLLARGVPADRIRMITLRPAGQPAHVMVLYTESPGFIDMMDFSTPHPPAPGMIDGINQNKFTAAVFRTRDSTVLLDPWSRIKASSFRRTNNLEEMMQMLDVALADTGHRPGMPFQVELTRPYPSLRDHWISAMESVNRLREAAARAVEAARVEPAAHPNEAQPPSAFQNAPGSSAS